MPFLGNHDVDSLAPLPGEATGKSVVLSLCALGGNEFPVVLEPGGRVRSVAGVPEAVGAVTARHGGDATLRDVVAEAITERKVKETLDFALVATPLPQGPVAAGLAWEDRDAVPGLSSGIEMAAAYRQEVAEVAQESVRVTGKGALEFRPATGRGANARLAALLSHAETRTAAVSAECSVSRADGLPLAASSELHLALGLRDAAGEKPLGEMTQDVRFRLDRVAAWPSSSDAR
jgi:hypothetical protein